MFTGLVTSVGTVRSPRSRGAGLSLSIAHELGGDPLAPGESINVDGCCLTVAGLRPGCFDADLSPETLSRSGGRGRWRAGRKVNLERALSLRDRLGGHFVQGHADGLLKVLAVRRRPGGWIDLRVALPAEARDVAVSKASVALDGVSLTIAACRGGWFETALTPATIAATTLGRRRAGDRVIVEWDVLARVAAAAAARTAARGRG